MNYKYKVSIISMFKNEEMIMEEWIQHYIREGIDHFYLIDNGSTDNYGLIINKYNDKITLVIDSTRHYENTQPLLFNKHFLDIIKEKSEWVIVCDMDEYIYSRNNFKTIKEYVNNIPENIEGIALPWKNFGSNNIQMQPESIVSSFVMREDKDEFNKRIINNNVVGNCKCLTKTTNIKLLNVHEANRYNSDLYFSDFTLFNKIDLNSYDINSQNLHLNHYQHMSYEYYTSVKIIRGNAQNSFNGYNLFRFYDENILFNKIEDYELANNKYVKD